MFANRIKKVKMVTPFRLPLLGPVRLTLILGGRLGVGSLLRRGHCKRSVMITIMLVMILTIMITMIMIITIMILTYIITIILIVIILIIMIIVRLVE